MTQHTKLSDAISEAAAQAPRCVGYKPGGWYTYDPKEGTDGVPEFFVYGQGRLPIPLSQIGAQAWLSLVMSLISGEPAHVHEWRSDPHSDWVDICDICGEERA
jgi:hypothetical protein